MLCSLIFSILATLSTIGVEPSWKTNWMSSLASKKNCQTTRHRGSTDEIFRNVISGFERQKNIQDHDML